ncbi:MAG TPA: hypothetical protein VL285_22105 [Bryobacteraceae bacterium]|jgi:hypothetical protein|nr:hypothetical protein [Bryobacteraceae bacterium]
MKSVFLKSWRFVTVMLASLTTGMTFAHFLEMPQKMSYDAPMYLAVTHTLYRYFAVIGAPVEVGGLIFAVILCWLIRGRRPAYELTLAGTICWAAGLALWFALIAPANYVLAAWTPSTIPADWTGYRNQWEYTHAVRAVLDVIAAACLVASLVVETPPAAGVRRDRQDALAA